MNPLRQASFPSAGKPDKFKLTWSEFVQHVLLLTIKAYQTMYQARIAQRDWEENTFTIRLGEDYLRPIAFDTMRVIVRDKVHTPQMKKGEQPTIEAKEIDMSLYGIWEQDYHKIRFVWEAKRVGDKRIDPKYNVLNSEYVHEGVYRFIRREYADSLNDAGMLGYVLAGCVSNIVNDINYSMSHIRKNPPLPECNHLHSVQPIDSFKDVYRSHHTRTDNTKIHLHHLFLKFEFI